MKLYIGVVVIIIITLIAILGIKIFHKNEPVEPQEPNVATEEDMTEEKEEPIQIFKRKR